MPGSGIGIPRRPVHRPGLLLHDPEAALADAAVEVVMKAPQVGIAACRA